MHEDNVVGEISFNDESLGDVLSALKDIGANDATEIKQRGFTGVEFLIAFALAGSALSTLLAKLLKLWKCGVIVDVRGKKVAVEKNCDLPRGSVLIVRKDGTKVTLSDPSAEKIAEMVSAGEPKS